MSDSELTLLHRPEKENWQEQVATAHRDHAETVVNDPEALRTPFVQKKFSSGISGEITCVQVHGVSGRGLQNPSGPRKGGAGRELLMCRTMNTTDETRRVNASTWTRCMAQ